VDLRSTDAPNSSNWAGASRRAGRNAVFGFEHGAHGAVRGADRRGHGLPRSSANGLAPTPTTASTWTHRSDGLRRDGRKDCHRRGFTGGFKVADRSTRREYGVAPGGSGSNDHQERDCPTQYHGHDCGSFLTGNDELSRARRHRQTRASISHAPKPHPVRGPTSAAVVGFTKITKGADKTFFFFTGVRLSSAGCFAFV